MRLCIAITGSMNDGEYALEWNGESFDVMQPIHGDADKERISNKISRFKKLWSVKFMAHTRLMTGQRKQRRN